MKFCIFFSLLLLTVVSSEEKCGENQHYNECGTACPVTCDNYQDPPLFCIRICVPGCHCDEDYVLTDDGRCVKSEDCPPKEFSDYLNPDICELPAEQGVCDALFHRFYFDTTTGRCEKFIYGGCGGNRNNFKTLEECQRTCG